MEVEDLIGRIKERANDVSLRISGSYGASSLCTPAALETVREAERQMGLRLPSLLKRLYVEVGNGGFGPGYGLYGVTGGFAEDLQGLTLPELYLEEIDYYWPDKLVPICDWGCTIGSAVDCSSVEGEMVFVGDGSPRCMPEGISFTEWMEDWVTGVDLFQRAYQRYQKLVRPTLGPPFENY